MCLVCIDMEKGKMTLTEAKRNLGELVLTKDKKEKEHFEEVLNTIKQKEELYEKFYQIWCEGAD